MPFRVDEIVWGKIRGFPMWPAFIVSPEDSDANNVKIPKKKNLYFVKFVAATESDPIYTAWIGDGEIWEFTSHLDDMKTSARDKGGKTYIDLRKCIEIAEAKHKDFLQELEKNPNAYQEQPAVNPSDHSSGEPTTPKAHGKPGPKKSVTPARPVSAKKSKNAEPEAAGNSVVAPRLKIKPMPEMPVFASSEGEPSSVSSGKQKRVIKKRVLDDEDTPTKARVKHVKVERVSEAISIAQPRLSQQSIVQAKQIQVGFIGLENPRTKQVAKALLDSDVTVHVWSKESHHAKDLEYSRADRVNEPEQMFEEADVLFVSAMNSHELHQLLSGADHLIRKIRPQGKNKLKGVCIFGAISRAESESLAKKIEAKNILYLECAWIGSEDDMRLVASKSKPLYDHIKPILEIATKRHSFVGHACGQALVVSSAAAIANSLAIAGMVEAAYFAQQNGIQFDEWIRSSGLGSSVGNAETVGRILDYAREKKQSTASMFHDHYNDLRNAIHLAHPASEDSSSVTHLASFAMDLYSTQFATYRVDREIDQPWIEDRYKDESAKTAENGDHSGSETSSAISTQEKSRITNGSLEEQRVMNGIGLEEKTEPEAAAV